MVPVRSISVRDLRFDSLRGLMVVCMAVNHLPSALRPWTDESLGIFSAAEGFVLLSGIVAGWVYTRRRRAEGRAALRRTAQKRLHLIYYWHVAAFLAALAAVQLCARAFGVISPASPALFYQNPALAALLGVLLLHQPGLLDILPMYCAFVLFLPQILSALEAGRRFLVIGLSASAWLVVQTTAPLDGAPHYPINLGSFNLFAWQFLFVLGIVIGHAKATDPAPLIPFRPGLFAAAAAVAAYGWGVMHLHWTPPWSGRFFGIMLNKPNLGGLRLVDFAAFAYLVAVLGGRFPRLFHWRPLAFLGKYALPVVAIQSVAVLVMLEFPALFATPLANWASTAALVGFLFAAAGIYRAVASAQRGRLPQRARA